MLNSEMLLKFSQITAKGKEKEEGRRASRIGEQRKRDREREAMPDIASSLIRVQTRFSQVSSQARGDHNIYIYI